MKNLILNIILLISISMHSQSIDLLNPEKNIGLDNWNIVNDDVMGGISTSYLSVSDEKNLIFIDNVLLETEDEIEITASKISVSLDTTLIQANGPVKGIFSNNNVKAGQLEIFKENNSPDLVISFTKGVEMVYSGY